MTEKMNGTHDKRDPESCAAAGNYSPTTCLAIIWKLLTGIISEIVYEFLDTEMVLLEKQSSYRKGDQE